MSTQPEPWLRGPIPGIDPFLAPLFHSFQQAREDVAAHTAALTTGQLWEKPNGAAPVGYHIRHLAQSAERLMTYLRGESLSPQQLQALDAEMEPGATRDQLLAEMNAALARIEAHARSLDLTRLAEPRTVGRKALPTTAIGLLVHICEHTQRHVGQVVTTARIVTSAGLPR